MPRPRGKRTTLTVDRETFEGFFYLGSDGCTLARDAMHEGMIRTPYEAIALVCHVNQLEAEWHYWDMVAEMEDHGKDDDYIAAYTLGDGERANRMILEYVGRERLRQMLLDVRSDVREELGIPERGRLRAIPSLTAPEPSDEEREATRERFAPPMKGEPATVLVAPWRFEKYFELDAVAYSIALDAFRQSVIATPYEMVTMICDVNLMYSMRLRENAFNSDKVHTEWFEQMFDNLMLEIRTTFGVPEAKEIGTGEKYKLWLESRRKPIN